MEKELKELTTEELKGDIKMNEKEKMLDILGCIWLCTGFMIAVGLISLMV